MSPKSQVLLDAIEACLQRSRQWERDAEEVTDLNLRLEYVRNSLEARKCAEAIMALLSAEERKQ